MLLRILGKPLASSGREWDRAFCEQFVDQAVLGFAGHAAALRLYDLALPRAAVVASCREIPPRLPSRPAVSVGIARPSLGSSNKNSPRCILASIESENAEIRALGDEILSEAKQENEAPGRRSCTPITWVSGVGPHRRDQKGFSTLLLYRRRAVLSSWREIAGFKAFCRGVADTISSNRANADLERSLENLSIDGQAPSGLPIVAVPVGDPRHMTLAAKSDVEDYINRRRKCTTRRIVKATYENLELCADRARHSTLAVQAAVDRARRIYRKSREQRDPVTDFDFREILEVLNETQEGAQERFNAGIDAILRGPLRRHASALREAISIPVTDCSEAIRDRTCDRTHRIRIHACGEELARGRPDSSQRVLIHFWDDNPGVKRSFPYRNKVLALGVTSKPKERVIGLAVSRSLLGLCFNAQLVREDRPEARFKIAMPAA